MLSRESLPAKVQCGKIGEPVCEGEVESTLVQIMVDTGCFRTLVREAIVSFKFNVPMGMKLSMQLLRSRYGLEKGNCW